MKSRVSLVVAVTTYKRPTELRILLQSLGTAVDYVRARADVDIIVVDNDSAGSARAIIEVEFKKRFKYILQPEPGISAARNLAVSHALVYDYLVFVDDDEIVLEHWLDSLISVQSISNADIVAGPVHAVYPADAPAYLIRSGLFDRPIRRTLAPISEAGCGNILFRTSLFATRPITQWFDPSLGLFGGEDAELTRRYVQEGARAVWAGEAQVLEPLTSSRLNLIWAARRYRRIGAIDARLSKLDEWSPALPALSGMLRLILGSLSLVFYAIGFRRVDGASFRRLFRGIGFIEYSLSRSYEEYGRGTQSSTSDGGA